MWEDLSDSYGNDGMTANEDYTFCHDFFSSPTNVPEWDISVSREMDGDAFIQRLIAMDRAEFWKQAAEKGLEVDILKRVGYELNFLTSDTAMKAVSYLRKHIHGWPKTDDDYRLLAKIDKATSPDLNIAAVINRARQDELNYMDGDYPDADVVFEQGISDRKLRLYIRHETARLFLEQFSDDYDKERHELFFKFGANFIAQPQFESFYANNGMLVIENIHKAGKLAEKYKGYSQLLSTYKLLDNKDTYQLKSDKLKKDRVAINTYCAKELHKMIEEGLPEIWKMMLRDKVSPKDKLYNKFMSDSDRRLPVHVGCRWKDETEPYNYHEVKFNRLSKWLTKQEKTFRDIVSYRMFYYAMYNIIDWPKEYNMTDRCIFLYHLAHVCGVDKAVGSNHLVDGFDRKDIADPIKRLIKNATKYDSDKRFLTLLTSELPNP